MVYRLHRFRLALSITKSHFCLKTVASVEASHIFLCIVRYVVMSYFLPRIINHLSRQYRPLLHRSQSNTHIYAKHTKSSCTISVLTCPVTGTSYHLLALLSGIGDTRTEFWLAIHLILADSNNGHTRHTLVYKCASIILRERSVSRRRYRPDHTIERQL